jgi:hypothetical protein
MNSRLKNHFQRTNYFRKTRIWRYSKNVRKEIEPIMEEMDTGKRLKSTYESTFN